jgi:hypothetical protein
VNNFGIEVQKIPYKTDSKNIIARSETTKQSSLLNEKRDCRGLKERPRNERKSAVMSLRGVPMNRDDKAISLLWNKPEGGNLYSLRFWIPHQSLP